METDTQQPANWKLPFFTVWSGQAFSLIGSRLAQFALVWWLTESTGSATILATATLVAILPNVLIGPFAGVLIDRWERRKVMIAADSFVAVVSLVLALLFWSGKIQVWHIFAAMLARATGEVLHLNAMQASTSLMVPNEHLARVAGANQTMRGALNVAAPPLGALLMSLLPLHYIMGIDVVTALIAVSPLFFIPIPQPQPAAGDEDSGASILQQMRSGFRYVWAWPGLKAVLIVIMLINFVVDPAFSLMPLLVTEHFKGDAIQLGWLESAWGIGMMLGGIGLGIWGGFRRQVFTSFSGMIVGGLAIFCFGLVPGNHFAWAVAALLITGITNPFINGPFFAILQSTVEPAMQGRVFTLVGSLATAMMPLSLAIAGPVSDLIGIRTWYVGGGAIFALVGVALFFIPVIVNLEHNNGGKQAAPAGQSVAPSGD